ncbi:hypothetical protein [Martelella endophytica]|uniref:Uncharacterized protein n=1 Tax=Martelella endophytica TaxID=1486262 RepID=A0A0D5LLL3_MAREN|nr:hypothetical protein [Martelella endophytica]AJY44657.1 hypothetical protein TM49_01500 [Martelella endophytica]
MAWAIFTWLRDTRLGRFAGAALLVAIVAGAAVWWVNHAIHGVWTRGLAAGELRERIAWEQKAQILRDQLQAVEDDKQAALDELAATNRSRDLAQAQRISGLQMQLAAEREANAKDDKSCGDDGPPRPSRELWEHIRQEDAR